jgi:Methylase involved in ubiquinone/menaquinone biosynthesis
MTTTTFDWTAIAPSWGRHRAHVEQMKEALTRELLAALDLQPGQHVLELGAGTGDFARQLAQAVGPTGSVLATDVASGMVELLRDTTAGLPNVEVARLDAVSTDLPDETVDAIAFRMGLMFVAEPLQALRECRRVLTAAGRIALAVWAGPEHNPWLASVGMSAMMHGLVQGGPPTSPGGVFSLADPAVLERLVVDAGFADVVVHEVATPARFASADEHFDVVSSLAGPLSATLAAADESSLAAVRATTAQTVARFRTADGLLIPGRALLCTAHPAT